MIRKALHTDSSAITSIQLAAWKLAYREFIAEDILENLSFSAREQRWKHLLKSDREHVYVSCTGSEIRGFLHLLTGTPGGLAEIIRLYVDPKFWRNGVGRELLEHAFGIARQAESQELILWVAELNAQARSFYEAFGLRQELGVQRIDAFSKDGAPLEADQLLDPNGEVDPARGQFREVLYRIRLVC